MKRINSEKIREDIVRVVSRFPLAMIFVGLLTIWQLPVDDFFFMMQPIDLVFSLGILFSMTSQLFYERFFKGNKKIWWLLKGAIVGLLILYYVYLSYSLVSIDGGWTFYSIPGIRTMILFFIGTILFIWAPTIQKNMKFSESFLAAFKNYFSTIFFSVILFIGIISIFGLFEFLFFRIDFSWGSYTSTLVFNLFAPVFFLTNIPKVRLKNESTQQAVDMPKFLMYLVSYILVPIMALLTGIIVLYIVTNLTNEFFTDNILEGLLLSYTINGWILLLLADGIRNNLAKWFRKIFPYSLIFVVALQMISTFLEIQEVGITHGRYFILLFGVGSILSAVWYILKKGDLKVLPLVAVAAGVIALIPPIDAMSLSVNNQRSRIESILTDHGILNEAGDIAPNAEVPEGDKTIVRESLNYLSDISALNQLEWLPEEQYYQRNEYLGVEEETGSSGFTGNETLTDVYTDASNINFSVNAYDHLLDLSLTNEGTDFLRVIETDDQTIEVTVRLDDEFVVSVSPEDEENTQTFDFSYVLEEFEGEQNMSMATEELTFTEGEGDETVQVMIKSLYRTEDRIQIDFYLMF